MSIEESFKSKYYQEFEKKQSRKRGREDVEEEDDEEDSQFFKIADKTLKRMTSKDEPSTVADDNTDKEKMFKSPMSKIGPLKPLQNLGKTVRGSFIARGEASLGKIAQFNKNKKESSGTRAKGNNFVFAPVSPQKEVEETETKTKVKQQPPAKRQKVSRALNENSKGTIFNLL